MSEVYLITIRLNHTRFFLVVDRRSDTFLLNSDRTLVAFRTLADARASYPDTFIPMCSSGSPPDFVVDLDAALTWCAKPPPRAIESVDQSEAFWDVVDLLDKLAAAALCTEEARRDFRAADTVVAHVLSANLMTIATIPSLSTEESEKLRVTFEAGIAGLRGALPKDSLGMV
jgi:hypothetical protein